MADQSMGRTTTYLSNHAFVYSGVASRSRYRQSGKEAADQTRWRPTVGPDRYGSLVTIVVTRPSTIVAPVMTMACLPAQTKRPTGFLS